MHDVEGSSVSARSASALGCLDYTVSPAAATASASIIRIASAEAAEDIELPRDAKSDMNGDASFATGHTR
jgi:hypothetical protein